jgi:hypothetical protein
MNAQPKRAIQLVHRSDSFDGTEAAGADGKEAALRRHVVRAVQQ